MIRFVVSEWKEPPPVPERLRCRCGGCTHAASQEDLLCDWCRDALAQGCAPVETRYARVGCQPGESPPCHGHLLGSMLTEPWIRFTSSP